jgi:hypothetical protein
VSDLAFLGFAVATSVAFGWMTLSRPRAIEVVLTVGVWVGFAIMLLDRFWLRRRGR